MEKATFAAGCFWGVQLNFDQLDGVLASRVGYIGGHMDNPDYKSVCSGTTRHAEAVEVDFDPAVISYETLVEKFWEFHDPTTLDRQGPDVGSQYRSEIFYHSEDQKTIAENSKQALDQSGKWANPVVTAISSAPTFWLAEDYHQDYLKKRGITIACH